MAIEINDERPLVKVNPLDANKVVIQEVNTQVKVTGFGPQGAVGPAGAAGAAGEQGEPGRFTVSETAPATPTAGDAWFRSSSAQLYLYYDGYWVETSTSYAGPTGATGAQGPTGSTGATGDQGESFSFRGAYGGSEIVYNLNDVVTYNGSSYICLSNNVSGSQPDSLVSWDIFVEKGATGATGATGASGTSGLETWTRYSPTFQATGLTFTGSGATYPTYNSYYVKAGQLVSFVIEVSLATVTNFGTGQYKLQLPFTPAVGFNHFSGWAWADPNIDPDTGTGHTILNCDTAGITNVLDLHYLKQSGGANSPIRESLFIQGTPVTLTTISKIYVNGTYIAAAV